MIVIQGALSIIILMQLSGKKLTVVRKGCNSQIILWEQPEVKIILKAVPQQHLKESKHLQNQWKILSKLSHDNIVEVFRSRKDVILPGKQGNYNLLAQEFAQHGNLLQFLRGKNLQMQNRRLIFWEVVQAISYIHSNSIVHRDIKPQNILITDHQEGVTAKLADFGFSTRLQQGQQMLGSYKGTRRGYMAPEIHLCREDASLRYDPKASDIFALGVVLFALVMGRLPFEFATKEDRLYGLLAQGKFKQFWNSHSSQLLKLSNEEDSLIQEFQGLFQSMVTINPQKRLKIEQVSIHPWVSATKKRPQP